MALSVLRRLVLAAAVATVLVGGQSPATAAPSPVSTASTVPSATAPDRAGASPGAVVGSCTISGCAAARDAYQGWKNLNFPKTRTWYQWTGGKWNFAGGQFRNSEGQLPAGHTFWEYDVVPRDKGAARDAKRIVLDATTGVTWYSPDHYANFHRIV
ncbi:ribonuclease domain-containing protein [Longispora urticae]